MYYNENIKELLFDIKADINYIAWIILEVLTEFDCKNKRDSFKDYRKILFIIQLLLTEDGVEAFRALLSEKNMTAYENQILRNAYFRSKVNEKAFNAALIILERQEFVIFYKTLASNNIYYNKTKIRTNIAVSVEFRESIKQIGTFKSNLYKLKYDGILKVIGLDKDGEK